MNLEDAIYDLARKNITKDNEWYQWSVNNAYLPFRITLPSGTNYQKNVSLKLKLHQIIKESESNDVKYDAFYYYIKDWGGIRAIKDETIKMYAEQAPEQLIESGEKGIASWSKALCITDPYNYAIFDARVSASLNVLQKTCGERNDVHFPLLSSRNGAIAAWTTRQQRLPKHRYKEFYVRYLELLRSVRNRLINESIHQVEIYTLEMLLFAKAEELVQADNKI